MPEVLTQPNATSSYHVGPGIPWQFTLDSAAVAGDTFDVDVYTGPAGEEVFTLPSHVALVAGQISAGGTFGWNQYQPPLPELTWSTLSHQATEGERTQIRWSWRAASFSLKASGTIDGFTWTQLDGLWTNLQQLRTDIRSGAGLNADQAAQLDTVQANTTVTVAGAAFGAPDFVKGLAGLLGGIPSNFLHRHGSVLISGNGSIARGTEPFRLDAFGIEWHWNTIPDGYGAELGAELEYELRMVQWRTINQDDSAQLYQLDLSDWNYQGKRLMWGFEQPVTLEYAISPGVVVELSFLSLFPG